MGDCHKLLYQSQRGGNGSQLYKTRAKKLISNSQYHSSAASSFSREKRLFQQAEKTYMPPTSLGNLVMLLGLRGRKTEAKIKISLSLFLHWCKQADGREITQVSQQPSVCHFCAPTPIPDTSHWLQILLHYKQTISNLQHSLISPHKENRLFIGFSMKTKRFHLIFVSNTSIEKTLGSSIHG